MDVFDRNQAMNVAAIRVAVKMVPATSVTHFFTNKKIRNDILRNVSDISRVLKNASSQDPSNTIRIRESQ